MSVFIVYLWLFVPTTSHLVFAHTSGPIPPIFSSSFTPFCFLLLLPVLRATSFQYSPCLITRVLPSFQRCRFSSIPPLSFLCAPLLFVTSFRELLWAHFHFARQPNLSLLLFFLSHASCLTLQITCLLLFVAPTLILIPLNDCWWVWYCLFQGLP